MINSIVVMVCASIKTQFAMVDAIVPMDVMNGNVVSLFFLLLNSNKIKSNDLKSCSSSLLAVTLSESMSINGHGKLQVWNPTHKTWNPVCGENWAVPAESEQVCKMLGYKRSNETRLQDETYTYAKLRTMSQSNRSFQLQSPKRVNFYNRPANYEDQCRNTVTSVHIKCEHFGTFLFRLFFHI